MLRDNVVFFSNVQKPCVFVQIKIPRHFLHEFILLCLSVTAHPSTDHIRYVNPSTRMNLCVLDKCFYVCVRVCVCVCVCVLCG